MQGRKSPEDSPQSVYLVTLLVILVNLWSVFCLISVDCGSVLVGSCGGRITGNSIQS